MWKDAGELLGLSSPFASAALAYGFFSYVDRRASAAAKAGFAEWVRRGRNITIDARELVVGAFDAIYTRPLLAPRALGRSVLLSLSFFVFNLFYLSSFSAELLREYVGMIFNSGSFGFFLIPMLGNCAADYIALFVVRRTLTLLGRRPVVALFCGAGAAVLTIVACYLLFSALLSSSIALAYVNWNGAVDFARRVGRGAVEFTEIALITGHVFAVPALIVYIWLPLLALGALATRALHASSAAIGWVQWFVQRGDRHPFEAAGYVAAALVLVGTGAAQLLK